LVIILNKLSFNYIIVYLESPKLLSIIEEILLEIERMDWSSSSYRFLSLTPLKFLVLDTRVWNTWNPKVINSKELYLNSIKSKNINIKSCYIYSTNRLGPKYILIYNILVKNSYIWTYIYIVLYSLLYILIIASL
jgi:hypothetical protein